MQLAFINNNLLFEYTAPFFLQEILPLATK